MEAPTTTAKIIDSFQQTIEKQQADLTKKLNDGNLYGFEEDLDQLTKSLYNEIAEAFIKASAGQSEPQQRAKAAKKRLGKLVKRPVKIQLLTGHYVELEGLYAKKAPVRHKGSRHLLHIHWRVLKGASPGYYSLLVLKVGIFAAKNAHDINRKVSRHTARHGAMAKVLQHASARISSQAS